MKPIILPFRLARSLSPIGYVIAAIGIVLGTAIGILITAIYNLVLAFPAFGLMYIHSRTSR